MLQRYGKGSLTLDSTPIVRHLRLPPARERMSAWKRVYRGARGAIGTPLYAALAHAAGLPAWDVRVELARLAWRLMRTSRDRVRSTTLYNLLCFPMDSTRYFEFDFMWRKLRSAPPRRYLDVSSPRLLPLLLVRSVPDIQATFLNPDAADLQETRALVEACGLSNRCQLAACTVEDAPLEDESVDVVTCISVLEHIRADAAAVERMWRVLRPGGRLLLSVPCAAKAEEQFLNVQIYAFAPVEAGGHAFHQYVYDDRTLARLTAVTGPPVSVEIYGERVAGTHLRLWERKWIDADYPFWKEPWFMRRAFRGYASMTELPGEGVLLLEFIK